MRKQEGILLKLRWHSHTVVAHHSQLRLSSLHISIRLYTGGRLRWLSLLIELDFIGHRIEQPFKSSSFFDLHLSEILNSSNIQLECISKFDLLVVNLIQKKVMRRQLLSLHRKCTYETGTLLLCPFFLVIVDIGTLL